MIAAPPAPLSIDFHALGLEKRQALVDDVRTGLTKTPKELPPRWFYDDYGSELFEQITELPEYYQTRTEAAILRQYAPDIAARTAPEAIVELGSGSSLKTRLLIDAARAQGELHCFVPFDVSAAIVEQSAIQLLHQLPDLRIHAVIGDFAQHLDRIPRVGRQLIVFLGSTMGNFLPDARLRFLRDVRALLQPGDAFVLGVDLVKDERELVAAYDDAAGVTAAFNLNVLNVINSELGANFDPGSFQHVARWDREREWIEMHLRSLRDQEVVIPGADLRVSFTAGELLRTEISAKFTRSRIEEAFAASGLRLEAWYTDERQRFAEALAVAAS
ncbi:MAG TPA: L-histidine N(alpha)-methyltransferase [Chloroflexota bacterium]|nr:L-histidine N(alpha)-methyltransferase [Chloroflexota bacterium]